MGWMRISIAFVLMSATLTYAWPPEVTPLTSGVAQIRGMQSDLIFHRMEVYGRLRTENPRRPSILVYLPRGRHKAGFLARDLARELSTKEGYVVSVLPDRHSGEAVFLGRAYLKYARHWRSHDNQPLWKIRSGRTAPRQFTELDITDWISRFKKNDAAAKILVLPPSTYRVLAEGIFPLPEVTGVVILTPVPDWNRFPRVTKWLAGKKIFYMGSRFHKIRMEAMVKEMGGSYKLYEKAGSGYDVFYRTASATSDLKKWLDSVI